VSLSALRDALALLLRSPSQPSVELDTGPSQLPARSVGEIVKATVQTELVNGRSIIEIEGAPFDVKLPIPARAGETLRLQVLALAPRLTLAVLPTDVSGASDQVAVSESVRRLAAVLDQLMERAPEAAATARSREPAATGRTPATAREVSVPMAPAPATGVEAPVVARVPVAMPDAPGPVRVNETPQPPVANANTGAAASPREAPPTSPLVRSPATPGVTTPVPVTAAPATAAPPSTPGALPQASTSPPVSTATPASAPLSVAAEAEALKRATPVGAASPADAVRLAAALKAALSRSGLFYESHQAQWVAGERPLSELMQEPQAGLSRAAEPVHPQAAGLVRQQLEILDTRQLVWSGQLWPDQSMEWRIEEDQKQPGSAPDTPRAWKTSLRLTLPRLGAVTVLLSIQGDEVRVAFREVSAGTSCAIAAEQAALRAAFDRAGLQLLDLRVERDET
jgi:hypothetical protein